MRSAGRVESASTVEVSHCRKILSSRRSVATMEFFLGTKILVNRHTGKPGLRNDGVYADGVKAGTAEHPLCNLEEMFAFPDGHTGSIPIALLQIRP